MAPVLPDQLIGEAVDVAEMIQTPYDQMHVFTALLPQIDDMAELKTTLHVFRLLYARKGYPRLVTYGELSGDAALAESLKGEESPVGETLRRALEAGVDPNLSGALGTPVILTTGASTSSVRAT